MGLAASMGQFLLTAGAPGKRAALPHARILMHQPSAGVGGTASTSFSEPYNVARQFASLDHISGGRAAWNVVTSANDFAARNFGLDRLPPHGDRYERARAEGLKAPWSCWAGTA